MLQLLVLALTVSKLLQIRVFADIHGYDTRGAHRFLPFHGCTRSEYVENTFEDAQTVKRRAWRIGRSYLYIPCLSIERSKVVHVV